MRYYFFQGHFSKPKIGRNLQKNSLSMKILLTGAAGFIGFHSAGELQEEGYAVTGIDNFSDYYDVSLKRRNEKELGRRGIPILEKDLREPESYRDLPRDFDFIFHFAAQPGIAQERSFEDYFSNNVLATRFLLDFALENKNLKHFFNIGTSSVYGLKATFPETEVPRPVSHYGISKLAAEQLVLAAARNHRVKASSLRLYSVYGPGERPDKLFTKLIHCAFNDKEFPLFEGSLEHKRSFTFVGDIVRGVIQALKAYRFLNTEIINLGSEQEYSTLEGIRTVETILDKRISLKVFPRRPGDQLYTKARIKKAGELLHYRPLTSLREGLEKQVDWYRQLVNLPDIS